MPALLARLYRWALTVDATAAKAVLVWRGALEVQSEEFEEVQHLFVLSEMLEEPARSLEGYRRLFREALAGGRVRWRWESSGTPQVSSSRAPPFMCS